MIKRASLSMLTLAMATAFTATQAGTVSVVTSFPKELTGIYKKAFEAKNPDYPLSLKLLLPQNHYNNQ